MGHSLPGRLVPVKKREETGGKKQEIRERRGESLAKPLVNLLSVLLP
jgi:hypothetical protein